MDKMIGVSMYSEVQAKRNIKQGLQLALRTVSDDDKLTIYKAIYFDYAFLYGRDVEVESIKKSIEEITNKCKFNNCKNFDDFFEVVDKFNADLLRVFETIFNADEIFEVSNEQQ